MKTFSAAGQISRFPYFKRAAGSVFFSRLQIESGILFERDGVSMVPRRSGSRGRGHAELDLSYSVHPGFLQWYWS